MEQTAQGTSNTLPPDLSTRMDASADNARRAVLLKSLAGTSPTLGDIKKLIETGDSSISGILSGVTLDEIRNTAPMVQLPASNTRTAAKAVQRDAAFLEMRKRLTSEKGFTTSEVRELLACSDNQARYLLKGLLNDGQVAQTGDSNLYLYHFTDEGDDE